jgi:hypothetical protein
MAARHRKRGSRSKKIAMVGVATATATAMTVGAAPPPPKPKPVVYGDFDLAAAIRPFPPPDQIPDLTGGLGTVGYDISQAIADAVIRGVVGNVNFAALAQALGLDVDSLLQQLPADLLTGVLGAVPIDITPLLNELVGPLTPALILVLDQLDITDAEGNITLTNLLSLLGLDLSDPLNLAGLDIPGLNVITTGPPFTLLKLLGTDLGWVPGLPNSVANEINGTDYLPVGAEGLLTTLLNRVTGVLGPLDPVVIGLNAVISLLPDGLEAVDLRVPVVVGFGLGAFAAGAAYEKVLADLPNQPGGVNNPGGPLLGSITVLPMLLLRNPGRANGGLGARLYPLFGLFGIDTVTPETEVTSSGGIPILNTGLSLGGANLIPVKVDATVEYDLLSDFPSWPNPFSMANSLMGFVLPTYILRGLTLETVPEQLDTQLDEILDNPLGEPLAINLYLTVGSETLPLLEPLYLLSDITSIATFGVASTNPFGMLANALAPALTSLVNLGYTDVYRTPEGEYERTHTEAGVPTSFFSFPAVNPAQVLPDVINLLVKGFTKEFFSGNPTPATPNAITSLINLLTDGGLGPLGNLGNLGSLVQGVLDGLNPTLARQTAQVVSPPANAAPSAYGARLVPLSNESGLEDATDELGSAAEDSELSEVEGEEEDVVNPVEQALKPVEQVLKPVQEILTPVEETDEETTDEEATDEESEEEPADEETDDSTEGSGGKHAKPKGEDEPPPSSVTSRAPRHAKDMADKVTSGLRDIANAVTPKTNEKTTQKESPKDADDTKSDDDGAENKDAA